MKNIQEYILPLFVFMALTLSMNNLKAANVIGIGDGVGQPGSTMSIEVYVNNDNPFAAFQLDIPLPDGFNYQSNSISLAPSRITNHVITASIISGNILRIISYSSTNDLYLLNLGTIATFEVQTPTIQGPYVFTPQNAFIVDASGINILTGVLEGTISIGKMTPDISAWPVASDITYGESLSASVLSGGTASVPGSFSFNNPTYMPDAGIYGADVSFTPNDLINYNTVSGTVDVNVIKATASITIGSLNQIYNGTPRAVTISTNPAGLTVDVTYNGGLGVPVDAGTYTVVATINEMNYQGTASETLTVSKADPLVSTWPTASSISYGQALSSSSLNGGTANVPGSFDFSDPSVTPPVGLYAAEVVFSPTDIVNYNTLISSVNVEVNKAIASISITDLIQTYDGLPCPVSISTNPTGLSVDVTYNGSTTEPIEAGIYSVMATINEPNYQGTASASLTISKATPTVNAWPVASAISYGQALSASILSGGEASIAGAFSFTNPTYTPNAGTYSASVIFSPTDAGNYNTVSGQADVVVNKAIATVSINNTSQIYNGTPRIVSITTNPAGLTVVVTYDGSSVVPVNAGSYDVEAIINETNYQGNASATLNVARLTPTISSWPVASAITYGQALSLSVLSGGTASVAGSFAFTNPTVVPPVGNYSANVTFSPTDAVNYNSVSDVVDVTVNKANATVTITNTTQTYNGLPRPVTITTNPGGLLVNVTYNGSATAPVNAGSYSVVATINEANYQGSASSSLNVFKATPTVSVWPTASSIVYGQALSQSVLSGGAASVPGSFSFSAPTHVPQAGTYSASLVFAPTDETNYHTVSGTVNVAVNKASATVTITNTSQIYNGSPRPVTVTTNPTGLTVGITYNGSATVPSNVGSYAVVATINETNYQGSASATLTINKATPTVTTWPLATAISFGQTLSSSTLSGGAASVPGSFSFVNPSIVPPVGTYSATVLFTPADQTNYNTVSGTVNVIVNKAHATVSISNTNQTYNGLPRAVAVTTSPAGLTVNITYNGSGVVPVNAGTYSVVATINETNYQGSSTATLTVNKATAGISISNLSHTWDGNPKTVTVATTPEGLSYTITYNGSTTAPSAVGSYNVVVTINALNYQGSASATMVINDKVTPAIVWPTASSIVYGQSLGNSVLSGGSASDGGIAVAGSFAFSNPTLILGAGLHSVDVVFTPVNTVLYNSVTGSVQVTVNKAIATVSISNTSQTYNGFPRPVTITTNPAGLNVIVTYNGSGVVPVNAGSYNVAVSIDEDNYSGSSTATLVVSKASPVVSTWPIASAITYGQALSASTLSGGSANTEGSFSFTNPSYVPGAGNYSASVKFTPVNLQNYTTVSSNVTVIVHKANATITITNITQVYNGLAHNVTVATSPTGLTYSVTYNGSSVSPVNAGAYNVVVTITDNNYQGTANAILTVQKANPIVSTWPTASGITYGQPLSASVLSGGSANIGGVFNFANPTFIPSAGVYNAEVVFAPTNNQNYNSLSGFVNVSVGKATASIVIGNTNQTYNGSPRAVSITTNPEGLSVNVTYNGQTSAPVNVGSYNVLVTINENNYQGSQTATLVIGKSTPNISLWPVASNITYGQILSQSTLSGGVASVPGSFVFENPSALLAAGTYSVSVIFIPADQANYNQVTGSVTIIVEPGLLVIDQWPVASSIVYGQDLSSSVLSGGQASIPGSFLFQNPSLSLPAGTHEVVVMFVPEDELNYETVFGTVSVIVEKAMATIEISGLIIVYTGNPVGVSCSTNPAGLTVSVTYNGQIDIPVNVGVYNVEAGIVDLNYQGEASAIFEIEKANPVVSQWPVASDITYGEPLGNSILSGGIASPEGEFEFVDPSLVLDAGTHQVEVVYIPDDGINYNQFVSQLSVLVNQALAEVLIGDLNQTYTGMPLQVIVETNPPELTYSITYNGLDDIPVMVGEYEVNVVITENNYQGYANATFVISQADAIVLISNLNHIYDGTPKEVTINTEPPGLAVSVTYNGSIDPPSAIGTYEVVATVIDGNYQGSQTAAMTISDMFEPEIEWPTASEIIYGQAVGSSVLSGGVATFNGNPVAGSFSFDNPDEMPSAGIYEATVTFDPEDTLIYLPVQGVVSIVVNMATPSIDEWPVASHILIGEALSASILSGGQASTDGVFSFVDPEYIPLSSGLYQAEVIFNPSDILNYNTVTGLVDVVVEDTIPQMHHVTFLVTYYGITIQNALILIEGQTLYSDHNGEAGIDLFDNTYSYVVTREGFLDYYGAFEVDGLDILVPVLMEEGGFRPELEEDIKIYPNPFKDQLYIGNLKEGIRLIIHDLGGKQVFEQNIEGYSMYCLKTTLPKGVYIVRIIGKDGIVWVRKVIKD